MDVIQPTEALNTRASYAVVRESYLTIRPIQIFTKTGNSAKYRQYVAETVKKNCFPLKLRKNIAK